MIAVVVMLTGCVEEIPEPKYVPDDIIAEQPTDEDCLTTIISYNVTTHVLEASRNQPLCRLHLLIRTAIFLSDLQSPNHHKLYILELSNK